MTYDVGESHIRYMPPYEAATDTRPSGFRTQIHDVDLTEYVFLFHPVLVVVKRKRLTSNVSI